jgi:drug/metabolite transporter (DMT)-like permease
MAFTDHPRAGADLLGTLAILAAAAFWATSGIFIKLIMAPGGVSALALAFWRDLGAFGAFVLLHLAAGGRLRVLGRRDLCWAAGLGASLGLFHVALNWAVHLNGAAVTTLQQASMPAIVLVFERLVWGVPLTARRLGSLGLIFGGAVLITGAGALGKAEVSAGRVLAGFSVPVLYAAWSLLGKKLRADYGAVPILAHAFGFAVLVLLPFQLEAPPPWPLPGRSLAFFAGLVGLSTVGGFLVFTLGLGRLPAGVVTVVAMSEIVIAAALAYLFLGEVLTPVEMAGGVMIAAGIGLTVAAGSRRGR